MHLHPHIALSEAAYSSSIMQLSYRITSSRLLFDSGSSAQFHPFSSSAVYHRPPVPFPPLSLHDCFLHPQLLYLRTFHSQFLCSHSFHSQFLCSHSFHSRFLCSHSFYITLFPQSARQSYLHGYFAAAARGKALTILLHFFLTLHLHPQSPADSAPRLPPHTAASLPPPARTAPPWSSDAPWQASDSPACPAPSG